MRLYRLDDKVFSITGNAQTFLNGITSNTLDAPLNAFLNQHGRIIATVRQKKISDQEILIGVAPVAVEGLLKHLERYAKLSHALISPSAQICYIDLDSARSVFTAQAVPNSVNEEDFRLFRLEQGIPLMGIDYQADEFILNVSEQDYVSYTKGCFLGQEPVAKVHNRSRPSRKLVVAFEDRCSAEQVAGMTSRAAEPSSGRVKGFIFSPLPRPA